VCQFHVCVALVRSKTITDGFRQTDFCRLCERVFCRFVIWTLKSSYEETFWALVAGLLSPITRALERVFLTMDISESPGQEPTWCFG
jgi:hypothetical protein